MLRVNNIVLQSYTCFSWSIEDVYSRSKSFLDPDEYISQNKNMNPQWNHLKKRLLTPNILIWIGTDIT